MKKYAIVLAAGKGTRMVSSIPKCIYPFLGTPMIERIVNQLEKYHFDEIVVVVGYKKEEVKTILKNKVSYQEQLNPLGTADAIKCCYNYFKDKEGICLIIPSDIPLVDIGIINGIIIDHISNKNALTISTTIVNNNKGYGLVHRLKGNIDKIIEYNEANNYQKRIKEINCGIYCIDIKILFSHIFKIENNNTTKEYYLTDIVEVLSKKYKVGSYNVIDSYKVTGVNDLKTLKELEFKVKEKDNK